MSARYAVYFSPDDASQLAAFGQRALGRNAVGDTIATTEGDFPDTRVANTLRATPAYYGFHATLKAPFSLSKNTDESLLLRDVESLANTFKPLLLSSLYPRVIAGFVALTLESDVTTAVNQLASHCVERLEAHRATLIEADIARRQVDSLSETQRHYLNTYGYPYVLSEFKFHMTLTDKINKGSDAAYIQWLEELFTTMVPGTPSLDRLCVFYQADRNSSFTRLAEFVIPL